MKITAYKKNEFFDYVSDQGINWIAILERIRDQAGFVEDKQLADYLDIPQSTLSAVLKGRSELNMYNKFIVLDKFGFHSIVEAVTILKSDDLTARVRRAVRRQAQVIAEKNNK